CPLTTAAADEKFPTVSAEPSGRPPAESTIKTPPATKVPPAYVLLAPPPRWIVPPSISSPPVLLTSPLIVSDADATDERIVLLSKATGAEIVCCPAETAIAAGLVPLLRCSTPLPEPLLPSLDRII